jgi:hypothetical protein
MTKAIDKAKLQVLLQRSRKDTVFAADSDEHDFLLGLTRTLPVVYSELAKELPPKFCVKAISTYSSRKSNVTVCIWAKDKWVPLSQTKIFSSDKPVSKRARVLTALRTAVKGQIDYARAATSFPCTCPLTGKTLTQSSQTHVDHYGSWPFIRAVETWLNLYGLHWDDIALDRKGDLKDADVFKSWYNYHAETCDLRVVDKTANLKKGAKGWQ